MDDKQMTIDEIAAAAQEEDDDPPTFPPEERCPGCDSHKDAQCHRFSCFVRGRNQLILSAHLLADGTFAARLPEEENK